MKLLEIIPIAQTLPEVVEFISYFGERVLGKGIVYAKDSPTSSPTGLESSACSI